MKRQSVSALLAQVMYLANEANEKTDKCVFVDFSGHVNKIGVRVMRSKDDYTSYLAEADVYLSGSWGDPTKHLKNTIRSLQYLIDHGELDTDRITEVPVTHYEYHM